jgi:DNA invertase Pin-like site-specific DNA recombinase
MEKTKKAIVYTRGDNEAEQKLLCYFYASDNNIDVLFDTNDIDEVMNCEECDIVLVVKANRISRDASEYYRILKALKAKGVELVFTSTAENAERLINFMRVEL